MNELIERYQKTLASNPGNELARFSLGKAYYDAKRFEEARAEFRQALEARPDWMMVQILLGKCELALGQREEARRAFVRARELAIAQDHQGPREEMDQWLEELS